MRSFPVWWALALAAGVWFGDRFSPDPATLWGASLALASIGPVLLRGPAVRALLGLVLSASVGAFSIAGRLVDAVPGVAAQGLELTLEATPCGAPPFGAGLILCDATPVGSPRAAAVAPRLPRRIWLSAALGTPEALALARVAESPRIRGRVRLRAPRDVRNPGAADRRRALARRGIGARGFVVDPALVVAVRSARAPSGWAERSASAWIHDLRGRLAEGLSEPGPGGALLAALAVGDRSRLDATRRAAFARLGIAHLLAVSGLHVTIVAGLGYATSRRWLVGPLCRWGVADPRRVAAGTGLLAAITYAMLAGFGVPLRRALVVAAVWVATFVSGRSWPVVNVLALAAAVVLVVEPGALFEAGAQLSFAAAGALMLAEAPRPDLDRAGTGARLTTTIRRSLHASCVAIAATAPILAAHGMVASPFGLVVNLFAVPLAAALLLPTALLAAGVLVVAPSAVAAPLVAALAIPAALTLEGLVELAAALPVVPAPSAPGAAGMGVGVAVAWGAIARRPGRARLASVLALCVWLGSGVPSRVEPLPPRLVAFDVGQGDALLVQGRHGSLLVDGGRAVPGRIDMGARVVVPALRALGLSSLDVVMATHGDVDHRGGLESVLRELPVGRLWLPLGGERDPAFDALRALAAARRVPVEWIGRGAGARAVGDLGIEVLWPTAGLRPDASNDRSIVARISVGRDRLLLTGDIGRDVEAALVAADVDLSARVLKVAHHGSASSSDPAFLDAVAAEIAVVSAGCGARSGLPTSSVLERLKARGLRIGWTGRDGSIGLPLGDRSQADGIVRFGAARRVCRSRPSPTPPIPRVARVTGCE